MLSADNYSVFRMTAVNGHLGVIHFLLQKAPSLYEKLINLKDKNVHRALLALKRYDENNASFVDKDAEQAKFILELQKRGLLQESRRDLLIGSRKLEDLCILRKLGIPEEMLKTVHKDIANLRSTRKNPLTTKWYPIPASDAKGDSNSSGNKNIDTKVEPLSSDTALHSLKQLTGIQSEYLKQLFGRKPLNHVERLIKILAPFMKSYTEEEVASEETLNEILAATKNIVNDLKSVDSEALKIIAGVGQENCGILSRLHKIHMHDELSKLHKNILAELELRSQKEEAEQKKESSINQCCVCVHIYSWKWL